MKSILKTATFFVATIAFAFSVLSCNSTKPIDKSQLEGYWVLKTLKGETAQDIFKGPIPNLEFNFTDSLVYGNSGCNRFTGGFTLDAQNVFKAPNLASTRMMCIHENKESDFLSALSGENLVVSFDKDGLLTFMQGNEIVLQFEKGEAPAQKEVTTAVNEETLKGTWVLTSIAGGDVATLFTKNVPTMEFREEAAVSGNAGCNTYRTTYKLENDSITFKPAAMTMMACPDLKGEGMFSTLLTAPMQIVVNGDVLAFSKEGTTVLEFKKKAE